MGLLLCVCTGHDSIEIANVYILTVFTVFWKGDSLYCNATICRQLPNPQYGGSGGCGDHIYIYYLKFKNNALLGAQI